MALGSERAAFEDAKACLKDDLNKALCAQSVAEESVQVVTSKCQREINIFKFEKYKDGYEALK